MDLRERIGDRTHGATLGECEQWAEEVRLKDEYIAQLESSLAEAREGIERLDEEGDRLRDALDGLLDGLDANYDGRAGLRDDTWEKRIRDAKSVLHATKE